MLRLAGQLAWVGSLFPWLRSYNSALWASITATKRESQDAGDGEQKQSKKRPTYLIFTRRFRPALRWIQALFQGSVAHNTDMTIGRWFPLSAMLHEAQYIVRCDASPVGLGGMLIYRGVVIAW